MSLNRKEDCYVKLGQRIRHLRQMAEMTQGDLAKRMKLSRGTIANVEGGNQRLQLHEAVQIATIFKMPTEKFLRSIFNSDDSKP